MSSKPNQALRSLWNVSLSPECSRFDAAVTSTSWTFSRLAPNEKLRPRFQSDWPRPRPPQPRPPSSSLLCRMSDVFLNFVHSSLLLLLFFTTINFQTSCAPCSCFFIVFFFSVFLPVDCTSCGLFLFLALQNHVRSYWLRRGVWIEKNVLFLWTLAGE